MIRKWCVLTKQVSAAHRKSTHTFRLGQGAKPSGTQHMVNGVPTSRFQQLQAIRIHQFMLPQIACPEVPLLLGLAVSSYRIRAKVSEYFPSVVRISAKVFSCTRRCILFWGSETRLSSIIDVFLQTSGTGWGVFTIFRSLSTALVQFTLKWQKKSDC